jgi:signal transduction histidine kinase
MDVSEAVRLAQQAEDELGRVITISRATLAFHRESVSPEPVDLRAVSESVRFLLQGIIRERQIEFEIAGEGNFKVDAYPGETRQVILNLARNACEASPRRGSTVRLEFRAVDDGVELQVTDQGHGVDSSIIGSLFEFGRSTKGESGNGIGLWTVKQILKKHGGWITLDTQYKAGARFIAWLPRVSVAPKTPSAVGGAEVLRA